MLILGAACGSSAIFDADFDSDEGSTVDPDPSGDPPGDRIEAPAPPRSQVIDGSTAGLSGRALSYTSNPIVHRPTLEPLSLISDEVSEASMRYTVQWRANYLVTGAASPLRIRVLDQSDNELLYLRFRTGVIEDRVSGLYGLHIGAQYYAIPGGEVNRSRAHIVTLTIDKDRGTCGVLVAGAAAGSIVDAPLVVPDGLRRIKLVFEYESLGVYFSYFIDDVRMTQSCPDRSGSRGRCE